MGKKKTPKNHSQVAFVGNDSSKGDRIQWLQESSSVGKNTIIPPKVAVVYVTQNMSHMEWVGKQSLPWEDTRCPSLPTRILVIWDCSPVDGIAAVDWKDYLKSFKSYPNSDHTVLICPTTVSSLQSFQEWLVKQLEIWQPTDAPPEEAGLKMGDNVKIPVDISPELLHAAYFTLSFGVTQKRLEQLEYWRRCYLQQIDCVASDASMKLQEELKPILRRPIERDEHDHEKQKKLEHNLREYMKEAGFRKIHSSGLPVILLTGESGCGKTMFAKHLSREIGGRDLPFIKVALPEFEDSENMFEYDFFGFRGGSYSDAPPEGDPGILLKHILGIVFLDEIGDASPIAQRKLLGYLDDFEVRPRGLQNSIFCPTMIVAATNLDLEEEIENKKFRRDLYERIDIRVRIPSLNERKVDFGLLLDEILQNPGLNPNQTIKAIGYKAYEYLRDLDYKDSNFRRLHSLLQYGIRKAKQAGRETLLAPDLKGWE